MGFFEHGSDEHKAHEEVINNPHKADISHQVLTGAAAYAAVHEYQKHVAKNGQPPSHAAAKEILAGLAAAFVEREVETRGRDFYDKEKAKHDAKKKAEEALAKSGTY